LKYRIGIAKKLVAFIIEVYTKFNLKGFVRLDYIVEAETNKFFLFEINTIPGMSARSIFPKQLQATDGFVGFAGLYKGVVEDGMG
jgi:D-alanine-D-alanine ligase